MKVLIRDLQISLISMDIRIKRALHVVVGIMTLAAAPNIALLPRNVLFAVVISLIVLWVAFIAYKYIWEGSFEPEHVLGIPVVIILLVFGLLVYSLVYWEVVGIITGDATNAQYIKQGFVTELQE